MDNERVTDLFFQVVLYGILGIVPVLAKVVVDAVQARRASRRVLDAEDRAFGRTAEEIAENTQRIMESQDHIEQRAREVASLVEAAQRTIQLGTLFDLYNKQIEKYQTETQARAGWSFIFAIFSMVAGMSFVVWGGVQVFSARTIGGAAGAATVSAIGAALSGFITKTFLDVHRLSLNQLNRYFRQPVLNSNILTAQRLADNLEPSESRAAAYRDLIGSVISLIREHDGDGAPEALPPMTRSRRAKPEASESPREA